MDGDLEFELRLLKLTFELANAIAPRYRNGSREFSTNFNFGDHVGVGRRFGDHGEHELSLRVQHFSNAGIKDPNPGQNFLQVRYAHWF